MHKQYRNAEPLPWEANLQKEKIRVSTFRPTRGNAQLISDNGGLDEPDYFSCLILIFCEYRTCYAKFYHNCL
jgi:hypothetical protein